jgi:hypothetical protein
VKVGIMIATAVVSVIVVMVIAAMSDRFPGLARMPIDASLTSPPHGAWPRLPRHAVVDRAA